MLRTVATQLCVLVLGVVATTLPAAAQSNTGPYFGAAFSWATLPTDVIETEIFAPPIPPDPDDGTVDPEGLGGTLLIGYRASLAGFNPNLVAGIEFDGTFFGADETYNEYDYQSDWLITLRGVLGYQATSDLLLFATAGAAWLDFEVDQHGIGSVADDTLAGWVIGVGGEHKLTRIGGAEVLLRGDYLYTNFEGQNFPTAVAPPAAPTDPIAEYYENDTEMHQLRLGFVIRP